MRRNKARTIDEIAEKGLKYVIEERQKDWLMLCLKNCNSKRSVREINDLMLILKMIEFDVPLEKMDEIIYLGKYEMMGGEWLVYQIAKLSPKGESFIKEFRENYKITMSEKFVNLTNEELKKNKEIIEKRNSTKR